MSKYNNRDSRIKAQDMFNSYACIFDPHIKKDIDAMVDKTLAKAYKHIDSNPDTIRLWVDGSYNPKTQIAGIGIVIITNEDFGFDRVHNIAFGKTVKADTSLNAEIYALSIGLSYILDTFDAKNIHVYYDCSNSTVCAANIDAFVSQGVPFTNFKSALKRIRKNKINTVFEHTKAHNTDKHNIECDLLARYYSKAKLQDSQKRQLKYLIEK